MKYDLEDRAKKFSSQVITCVKKLKKIRVNDPLVSQLIRSATSVGANYRETNGSISK